MPEYVTVAKTSDIREGRGKAFTIKGRRIAVFNDDGEFYALDNTCAHALGPLGRGRIKNGVAVCPVHGYAYDAKTGGCKTDVRLRVTAYEVTIEGDEIRVKC
jgi:nitrite reductase (NADH) small subunit